MGSRIQSLEGQAVREFTRHPARVGYSIHACCLRRSARFFSFAFALTVLGVPGHVRAGSSCASPSLCSDIQTQYEKLQLKPHDKREMRRFVALLERTIKLNCLIEGTKEPVPGYRTCYGMDAAKDEANSQQGPLLQETVLGWFVFLKDSKQKEAAKILSNKEFRRGLPPDWSRALGQ